MSTQLNIVSQFTPKEFQGYIADFNLLQESKLHYLKGENKILVSSVHGFNHIRNEKIKPKDSGTILFSYLLARISKSNWIGVFQDDLLDSNYHKDTDIKKWVKNNKNEFNLLIDIHGSHSFRIPDIELGTMYGKTITDDKVEIFKQWLNFYHFMFVENETFAGIGEDQLAETMINFTKNKLNIDAIQLEINSSFIQDDKSLSFWHQYCKLLNCLTQTIKDLENE